MKKPARVLIFGVLAMALVNLCCGEDIKDKEKKVKKEISNTRQAGCLLRITSDPSVLPPNSEFIKSLIYSSGVGIKATRDVFEGDESRCYDIIKISDMGRQEVVVVPVPAGGPGGGMGMGGMGGEYGMGGYMPSRPAPAQGNPQPEQTLFIKLNVALRPEDKPVAEELMSAIIGNLRDALGNAFEDCNERFRTQLQSADAQAMRKEMEFRNYQKQLQTLSGGMPLHDIAEQAAILQAKLDEQQRLTKELEILARQTAEQISKTQEQTGQKLAKDAVIGEMEQLVMRQEKRLADLGKMADAGRVGSEELDKVQDALSRAKIELAERKDRLNREAGGDKIADLHERMASMERDRQLTEARARELAMKLAETKQRQAKTGEYEVLTVKMEVARRNLDQSLMFVEQLGRKVNMMIPPSVTAIGNE